LFGKIRQREADCCEVDETKVAQDMVRLWALTLRFWLITFVYLNCAYSCALIMCYRMARWFMT